MHVKREFVDSVCAWNDCSITFSIYNCNSYCCCGFDPSRLKPLQILKKGDSLMKIVVVRSPKALRGILKLLFGIKGHESTV